MLRRLVPEARRLLIERMRELCLLRLLRNSGQKLVAWATSNLGTESLVGSRPASATPRVPRRATAARQCAFALFASSRSDGPGADDACDEVALLARRK